MNKLTRNSVGADNADFEIVGLKVGSGKGLDHKFITVQVVLPKTRKGIVQMMSEQQEVADTCRALRIRYQEDTGARDVVAAGKKGEETKTANAVQELVDSWDGESRVSKAAPKHVFLAEAPKTVAAMKAALEAAGIKINFAS